MAHSSLAIVPIAPSSYAAIPVAAMGDKGPHPQRAPQMRPKEVPPKATKEPWPPLKRRQVEMRGQAGHDSQREPEVPAVIGAQGGIMQGTSPRIPRYFNASGNLALQGPRVIIRMKGENDQVRDDDDPAPLRGEKGKRVRKEGTKENKAGCQASKEQLESSATQGICMCMIEFRESKESMGEVEEMEGERVWDATSQHPCSPKNGPLRGRLWGPNLSYCMMDKRPHPIEGYPSEYGPQKEKEKKRLMQRSTSQSNAMKINWARCLQSPLGRCRRFAQALETRWINNRPPCTEKPGGRGMSLWVGYTSCR